MKFVLFLLLLLLLAGQSALADTTVREVRLYQLIDGDTFWAVDDAKPFKVRVAGIDTPESRAPKCPLERVLAAGAANQTATLLLGANHIELIGDPAKLDKYGRWLGIVEIDGRDLGAILIDSESAVPWAGKRHNWCNQ